MDRTSEYATAHDHALSCRYREAREVLRKILDEEPSHVEALLLLAKVEHYLGHACRSRRCFETALAYDPSNVAAYLGIEHYRRRRRAAALVACTVALALAGLAVAAIARRYAAIQLEASAEVMAAVEQLSLSLEDLARAVDEARGDAVGTARDSARALAGISAELFRLRRESAALTVRMDELHALVLRATHTEPEAAEAAASP